MDDTQRPAAFLDAEAHPGRIQAEIDANERVSISWALEDQIEFGKTLVADGAISAEQLDLAVRYATATGVSIGHALIYTGAMTQRHLISCLERLWPTAPSLEAAAARRQSRLRSGLAEIASAIANGRPGDLACTGHDVSREAFRAELRRRLRAALASERGGLGSADQITGRVMRGVADYYEIVLVDHLLRAVVHGIAAQAPSADVACPYRPEVTAIPGIAGWKASFRETVEATDGLADAPSKCAAEIPERLRQRRFP